MAEDTAAAPVAEEVPATPAPPEVTETAEAAEAPAAPSLAEELASGSIPGPELSKAEAPEIDPDIVSLLEEGDKPIHEVDIKILLEAGVHFGHQTKRWNPKMARYIFGKRNDIHIIDLQKTLKGLNRGIKFLQDIVRKGGKVLFVSTKRQAQEIVARAARNADQFWVTERWLGGMLTNFETIKKRVKHLKHLQKMEDDGILDALGKKEQSKLKKQLARLEKYLGGIAEMKTLPDAIFMMDPRREAIAVKEARKLGIKIVGVVDTNCDPDEIDFVIPGNDDAIRAIKVLANYVGTCLGKVAEERQKVGVKSEDGEGDKPAKKSTRKPAKKAAKKKAPAKKKTAAKKAEPKAKADEPKADAKPKAKAKPKADEKPKAEAKAKAKADAKADEPKAEAKAAEPKAEEPKADA